MTLSQELESRVGHLVKWAKGRNTGPFALTLGMTYVCNLRCTFCALRRATPEDNMRRGGEELPEERLIRLVREAAQMGVEQVNVSGGGEPFLRQKTLSVMRAIKHHGMRGAMTSNGTLISEEAAEEMVRIGWDHVNLSIDGPNPETHDYLRDAPGSFELATRAASTLHRLKLKYNRPSPAVGIHTVLTQPNHNQVFNMVRLVHELGATEFTLIPLTVHYPEQESLRLLPDHWDAFRSGLERAKDFAEGKGISTNLDDFSDRSLVLESNDMIDNHLAPSGDDSALRKMIHSLRLKIRRDDFSRIPCYEPWFTLVIHPDGYIDPCEMVNKVSHIGDRSLSELWSEDAHLRAMRKDFLKGRLPATCAKCCGPLVVQNVRMREHLSRLGVC